VPNSPRANIARPQLYSPPAGHSIMAVGQTVSKKRTIVVTQGEAELAVHTLSRRGAVARKSEAYSALHDWPQIPNDASLRPLGLLKSKYCFIDAGGSLIELNERKEAVKHTLIAAASRAAQNAFVYVIRG